MHLISRKMPRREFEGVRVSSVDNYQGEENDLILLSLVRSNNDNDIGFLKMNNRICVALSRAKVVTGSALLFGKCHFFTGQRCHFLQGKDVTFSQANMSLFTGRRCHFFYRAKMSLFT